MVAELRERAVGAEPREQVLGRGTGTGCCGAKELRALIDGMLPRLTFPSCRWRCSTAPACGFRSFMTVMHHAWM
ncbi:hypothetical protein [Nonomuraea fuscirosea]|uniref:hypothetical protein n=1 Tax=Nonomuraea fuscirosea TaxID=1291556 RepID=UPI0011B1C843|nr:hypothetical protein [Nonomuraea fuscirosea]